MFNNSSLPISKKCVLLTKKKGICAYSQAHIFLTTPLCLFAFSPSRVSCIFPVTFATVGCLAVAAPSERNIFYLCFILVSSKSSTLGVWQCLLLSAHSGNVYSFLMKKAVHQQYHKHMFVRMCACGCMSKYMCAVLA